MMEVVKLSQVIDKIDAPWSPVVVADYNENEVFVAKFAGEFLWHSHPETDDLFFVLKGEVVVQLRDKNVSMKEGDLFVVPKGVEHCPMASSDEAYVLLIEPKGTPNTGDESTATPKIRLD